MSGALRVEAREAVDEVPGELWDVLAPDEFFFQRAFLKVMEASGVEGARYRYLLLFDGEAPVGLAVLSTFVLKLDLLTGSRWIGRLRRWAPGLLDVPIVCCGVPASFGQHHLHLTSFAHRAQAFRCVHDEMERWAAQQGCGLLVWKEWGPAYGLGDPAEQAGYLVLPTLPDHVLEPLPSSVDDLLASMRSSYRRKFRTAVALLSGAGPEWADGRFRLEQRPFRPQDSAAFHRGYLSVMDRTPVRLEIYPRAFFEELASSGLGAFLLRLESEHAAQSITALLIPNGRALSFLLVAKERARYDDALYALLLQCIVVRAVQSGFGTLRLGQTSGYSKCAVGAQPARLEAFLCMRRPFGQRLLARLGPLLFPETSTPELRVFKNRAAAPSPARGRHATRPS